MKKEPQKIPIPINLIKEVRNNYIFMLPSNIEKSLRILGINRLKITFISKDVRKNGK